MQSLAVTGSHRLHPFQSSHAEYRSDEDRSRHSCAVPCGVLSRAKSRSQPIFFLAPRLVRRDNRGTCSYQSNLHPLLARPSLVIHLLGREERSSRVGRATFLTRVDTRKSSSVCQVLALCTDRPGVHLTYCP